MYKIPLCQYCGSKSVEEVEKNYLKHCVKFYCYNCKTHFSFSYEQLCVNDFANVETRNKIDLLMEESWSNEGIG